MICIKPQKHRKVAQQNSPRGECRGGGEGGEGLGELGEKGRNGKAGENRRRRVSRA